MSPLERLHLGPKALNVHVAWTVASLSPAVRSLPASRRSAAPSRPLPTPCRPAMKIAAWALASLSVVASAAETQAPVPRIEIASGAPGKRVSSTGEPLRWYQPIVKLHVDDSLRRVVSDPEAIVVRALETWQAVPAEDLPEFEVEATRRARVNLEPDGINAILFAPIEIEGHENDLAITITFSDDVNGAILETDIVVNARYDFAELSDPSFDNPDPQKSPEDLKEPKDFEAPNDCDDWKGKPSWDKTHAFPETIHRHDDSELCTGTYDLESLLAHEAGHVLGLGEDTVDPEATMYFRSEPCDTRKRSLTEDDAAAINELYVLESPPGAAPAPTCSIQRRPPRGHGPDAVFGLSLLALALGVRRLKKGRSTVP